MKKLLLMILAFMPMLTFAQFYGTSTSQRRSNTNSTNSGIFSTTPSYDTGISTVNSNSRYQNGYTRSDGTYVQGHHKTEINSTNTDNYSTYGNTNTYTGTSGSRARDYSNDAYNYGSGRVIQTGPNGGQYYINSKGNKTYVPKRY